MICGNCGSDAVRLFPKTKTYQCYKCKTIWKIEELTPDLPKGKRQF